ncbi:MAG: dihydroorotase [Sphingomonas sanxanigenens]|uniref:Dihydroorotase n=1 Tax=Sphingomonas sanxanigenens TaxID=397260 RepID=A0A2W5A3P7_9SPHN|nr:MAG: dihydroorotase [Sphingomonas sanxanigenens]
MTNAHRLAIIGGKLPDGAPGGVLIEGDRIVAVGDFARPADADILDAAGAIIAPGLVDLGVFAVDRAAFRAGGITRAALMPDQSPALDHPALIQHAAAIGKPSVWIHPLAAATRGLKGEELAEIGLMKAGGAHGVATGRGWIADSGVMLRLLAYAAAQDLTVVVHSEDGGLTDRAVATDGETATRLGLPSAPAAAEAMAIARDLALAEASGAHIHFRQVTTSRGLDLIRAAKRAGLPVTAGITPAHLFLSDIAMTGFRTFTRLSPPLRSEADRQAALAAVADGTIDVIASGHDPRGPEDKRLPFADAAPGMAGAETLLALSLGLVRDGLVNLPRLFELLSANPARILGVPGGSLEAGAPADLILFDPGAPWKIDSERLVALAGNTPFDGLPVQGKVLKTLKGGQPLD